PTSPVNSQDLFGISVSIDDNRVAVGRPGKHVNGMQRNGCVQLHINDGTGWALEEEVVPESVFGILDFGNSVVLEGSRLAVGMPADSQAGQRAGALVVFERQKAGWAQIARMVASDGQTEDQLGIQVGMSGNRVAGSAPRYGQHPGSVYIYDEDGGWQDEPGYAIVPTLFADASVDHPLPMEQGAFGYRVDHDDDWGVAASFTEDRVGQVTFLHRQVDGDWVPTQTEHLDFLEWNANGFPYLSLEVHQDSAIVGFPNASIPGQSGGCAVLFVRGSDDTWSVSHVFSSPYEDNDWFGFHVDLDSDQGRVVVGAPILGEDGSVFIFDFQAGSWATTELVPEDSDSTDVFGMGLDLIGDWLVVGAPGQDNVQGHVMVYNWQGDWTLVQTIDDPSGSEGGMGFGYMVSLGADGDLLISSPTVDVEGVADAGAVYVYTYASKGFALNTVLTAPDKASSNWFGYAMDRKGNYLAISEPYADDAAVSAGRIWLYEKTTPGRGVPSWIRVAKLISDSPRLYDVFGFGVSIDSGVLLTGAAIGAGSTPMSGQVKVFETPFMSFWNDVDDSGMMGDPDAWIPKPPSATRGAVFSNWGGASYDLHLDKTSDVTSIRIGLDQVRAVPTDGGSTFGTKADPVSMFVGCPPDMSRSTAALSGGELTINGHFYLGTADLAGEVRLEDAAKLTVDGTWTQASRGRLSMTVYEGMTSRLEISDTPQLGGTLSVQGSVAGLEVGAELPLIDSELQSGPLVDRFDLALLPGLPGNRAFILHQGGETRGSTVVWLQVIDLADLIAFDDDEPYAVGDGATAVLTADLNDDGYAELVVVLGGSPGSLVVFNNDGTGGFTSQDVYEVGNEPAGLASGDFDADGDIDLAVSNFADNTVDIFRNDGTGLFTADVPPLAVGVGPLGLGARDLDLNGTSDLLVCCSEEREIQVYSGASLRGSRAPSQKIPTDGKPGSIDPADYDKEKGGDVGATTEEPGMILTMSVDSTNGQLSGPQGHPSGPKPSNIKGKDVDDDGEGDFVASDEEDGTVTVLKKSADTRGYELPLVITVGVSTGSLTLLDFDVDGDEDIAVVATLVDGSRVARLLRNDSDLYGGSLLVFADAEDLATDVDVLLLSSGDLDRDGDDDLVVIGERDLRGGRGLASTLGVYDNPRCLGDADGDQVVDVSDLLVVISEWGECNGCTCDFNLDGMVDVMDLLEVIAAWGACSSK
ncbi:MAG: FG-GAP-like repeat-containing protein, partial [Planctomycetota bacterium]|nr:FG-GAP-like repeat-containing protein [Planctomycetota bacterium]